MYVLGIHDNFHKHILIVYSTAITYYNGIMVLLPSILSANWSRFGEDIAMCEDAGASHLHFDVMDGHFVPTLSFGTKFVEDIRPKTKLFFDIHLMVQNPQNYISSMAKAGANMFTFHIESENFSFRCIQAIRDAGMQVGVALNPQTPITAVQAILSRVDLVLIMTVDPGFGGQKHIEEMHIKLQELSHLRKKMKLDFLISVDGGIDRYNIPTLCALGVDWFVIGSAFFSQEDKKGYFQNSMYQQI